MDEEKHAEEHLYGHYNPVKTTDTVGAMFLGLLAILLLIALLRSQALNRKLIARLAQHDE